MSKGFQDPYMEPGATVLRNKLGITDRYTLSIREEEFARLRTQELAAEGVTGRFDLEHFSSIHGYIFQDIYEWAGQPRTVNIGKGGTFFARASRIDTEMAEITRSLESENHLKDLSRPDFAKRLAHYYALWNAVHPFREGNGRSTRMIMGQLAANAGHMLDVQRIENGEGQWNEASKRSFNGDLSLVTKVLTHAVRDPRAVLFERAERETALRIYPDLEPVYKALDVATATASSAGMSSKALITFVNALKVEFGKRIDGGLKIFDPVKLAAKVPHQTVTQRLRM